MKHVYFHLRLHNSTSSSLSPIVHGCTCLSAAVLVFVWSSLCETSCCFHLSKALIYVYGTTSYFPCTPCAALCS